MFLSLMLSSVFAANAEDSLVTTPRGSEYFRGKLSARPAGHPELDETKLGMVNNSKSEAMRALRANIEANPGGRTALLNKHLNVGDRDHPFIAVDGIHHPLTEEEITR